MPILFKGLEVVLVVGKILLAAKPTEADKDQKQQNPNYHGSHYVDGMNGPRWR